MDPRGPAPVTEHRPPRSTGRQSPAQPAPRLIFEPVSVLTSMPLAVAPEEPRGLGPTAHPSSKAFPPLIADRRSPRKDRCHMHVRLMCPSNLRQACGDWMADFEVVLVMAMALAVVMAAAASTAAAAASTAAAAARLTLCITSH